MELFFFWTKINLSCWKRVWEGEDLGSGKHQLIEHIKEEKQMNLDVVTAFQDDRLCADLSINFIVSSAV